MMQLIALVATNGQKIIQVLVECNGNGIMAGGTVKHLNLANDMLDFYGN